MLQSCEAQDKQTKKTTSTFEIQKTEQEWKKILSPEAFYVLRQQGTERAFTGKYYKTKDKGVYHCAGCDNPLFSSEHKYDSGTGWPSFWQPIQPQSIGKRIDYSHGMVRNEVYCAKCGGHLGHVFDDGPKPTGLRYCINSVSLVLKKVQ
ncbi:MAG: peptide-methionine (R)-S-oxide reductase MsrB [Microscillaceae bacterium]|nr:peptide-methionine (R)-S-oxide reductase MsrB [Microscillaceae bacterium]